MKRLALFAAFVAAVPAHAQQRAPQAGDIQRPMQALDPIDGETLGGPARGTLMRYGACVADHSPEKARSVLLADFRTSQYRSGLRNLSDNNHDCFGGRGSLRSANVLFAGAIAERLLAADKTPLNVRLARAAAGTAPAAFGPSDALAGCVVRSAPDDVAALFATRVDSQEEARSLKTLDFVVGRCSQGRTIEINSGGLRAILATAAFRNVEAAN